MEPKLSPDKAPNVASNLAPDLTPDRYTRLKAITDFGYDITWSDLAKRTITIAGVGGLGMITAEILARCGVGQLNLFDKDTVDTVNLNRIGFLEADIGQDKVSIIAKNIRQINPDVNTHPIHGDIMNFGVEDLFDEAVANSDAVMMGVDNYPARMFVNQKCINYKKPLFNAGVSRSALSGFVQSIFPGKTACLQCVARVKGSNENLERGESCVASLPTTFAIIAGIQAQEALKYLLGLGTVLDYITYNALTGDFHQFQTTRDPHCSACSTCDDDGDDDNNTDC
ncbi:MAG: HesA/MoeB/ThiF family protein [Promethearchaeota archaeon]